MLKRFLSLLGTLALATPVPMGLVQEVETPITAGNFDLEVLIGQSATSTAKTSFGHNDVRQEKSKWYIFPAGPKADFIKVYSFLELTFELSWNHKHSQDVDSKIEVFVFDLASEGYVNFKINHYNGLGKEESEGSFWVDWIEPGLEKIDIDWWAISHVWRIPGSIISHEVETTFTLKKLKFISRN